MEVLREDIHESEQELQRGAELQDVQMRVQTKVEEDVVDDGVQPLVVVESKTRDIISDVLNRHKDQVSNPDKVVAYVEFDGNRIFKSTLVGQVNGNPFLSKDRLTRVKKSLYFNNNEDYLNAA